MTTTLQHAQIRQAILQCVADTLDTGSYTFEATLPITNDANPESAIRAVLDPAIVAITILANHLATALDCTPEHIIDTLIWDARFEQLEPELTPPETTNATPRTQHAPGDVDPRATGETSPSEPSEPAQIRNDDRTHNQPHQYRRRGTDNLTAGEE